MNANDGKRSLSIDALLAAAAYEPPPIEQDPAARLLGLVEGVEPELNHQALKAARMRANLSVAELAARLSADGWKVTTSDAFRWETRTAIEVDPQLIAAIALVLGVSATHISRTRDAASVSIATLDGFRKLTERWARVFNLTTEAAAENLLARAAATVHRGDGQDAEQTLKSLELLIDDLEARGSNEN